jgi:hypothetical protein
MDVVCHLRCNAPMQSGFTVTPIVILTGFPTPAPDKRFQPFWLGKAHEMVGVLDDNLCARVKAWTDGLRPAFTPGEGS